MEFAEFKNLIRKHSFYFPDNVLYPIFFSITSPKNMFPRAFLLRGPPGTGKTSLPFIIAEILRADVVFYQCTYGTDEDDLIYKYVPSEDTKSGIKVTLGPIPLALKKSRSKKVVLIIDEFDKTRPSADALLLDVLQNTRVSLYIDDKETIVSGDPHNIVVFITSNDMREFSEPLLRRVVQIRMPLLPTKKVYELLQRRFPEKLARLLAQIYDDTVNAKLRKPATIQELYQLGYIILSDPKMSLSDLLRMYIIKYDDDFSRFNDYVSYRTPYKWMDSDDEEESDDSDDRFLSYYRFNRKEISELAKESKHAENDKDSTNSLTDSGSRIVRDYLNISITDVELSEFNDEVVEDGSIVPTDIDHYTALIKIFKPEPTDNPTALSGVAVLKKRYSKVKALTYDDLVEINKYPEHVVNDLLRNSEFLIVIETEGIHHSVVDVFDKVLFFTKSLIRGKVSRLTYTADIAVIDGRRVEIVLKTGDATWNEIRELINAVLEKQIPPMKLAPLGAHTESQNFGTVA